MIENYLKQRGEGNNPDERLLKAFLEVPRVNFMHPALRHLADGDRSAPIGYGQTISQPSLVAEMTEWMSPQEDETILEIGTGSGYQAAILSRLAGKVVTVERIPELAARATQTISELGYANIDVIVGDGSLGHAERAPYDGIMLTAATPRIPGVLFDQLKDGGRIIAPVGEDRDSHMLVVGTKKGDKLFVEEKIRTQFVPLEGTFGWPLGTNYERYREIFAKVAASRGITPEEVRQSMAEDFGLTPEELFGR